MHACEIFGFAEFDAPRSKKSLNASLRYQSLALEWVQSNIGYFGRNYNRVAIFGQSSGFECDMQVIAYGGDKGAPFYEAICQSIALEVGSTSSITCGTCIEMASLSGCNSSGPQIQTYG